MAEDVEVGLFVLHHAMREVDLFRQPNGIHLAAHTADFARILPSVSVRIGEINGRIAGPFGVSRIAVGNAILPIGPIAFDSGKRKAL